MMEATNVEAKVQRNTGQVNTPQTGSFNKPQVEMIYRYEDEKGNLLFEVVRFTPKGFSQRRSDGRGGYIYNLSGVRRVLYRLPELIAAPLDEWVYIVEGEKDADRVSAEGFVATTNPGGAGKWLDSFNEYFRSRLVAIIPDNDDAGRKHAKKVADSIVDVAKSVRIIDLQKSQPGPALKGDVSDFFDAGHKRGELSILVDDTPEYVPEENWTRRAEVISLETVEPEEIEWLWPDRIPLGMMTILAGDPGVGKSFLSLYIASLVTAAKMTPDNKPAAYGSVVILSAEDSLENVVRPRLDALGANVSKIKAIRCMRNKDADGNVTADHFNILHDRFELERVLSENPDTKMVIIDPVSAYFGNVDTHKDSNVRSVLAPLVEMVQRFNVALVCIMHLNKGNSQKACYRTMGSLAFPAAARTVWLVSPTPDGPKNPRRLLIAAKHNILKEPTTLAFEIKDGRVVFESEPVNITADDVLAPRGNIEAPERQRAVEWLKEILSQVDSMPSNEIFKLAEEERFNERMLARARKELGIKCFPEFDEEGNKSWHWRLPKVEGEQLKLPNLADTLAKLQKMKQSMKMP
jgi:5S rRNA maturation endonuclease (ribonuclease M5)